jgi:hypothetical protein
MALCPGSALSELRVQTRDGFQLRQPVGTVEVRECQLPKLNSCTRLTSIYLGPRQAILRSKVRLVQFVDA